MWRPERGPVSFDPVPKSIGRCGGATGCLGAGTGGVAGFAVLEFSTLDGFQAIEETRQERTNSVRIYIETVEFHP